MRMPRTAMTTAALCGALVLAACGGGSDDTATTADLDPSDWDSVLAAADGQTVDWYMFGGDDDLNGYVSGYVTDQAAEVGVTLYQVRIGDTVEAVNKVLGERQAGRNEGGSVDLIWINGENFATGVQAELWYCGWPEQLPSAEFVDFANPAVANDFGIPVDGCEAAWNSSTSALVYDSAALTETDVASLQDVFAWAEANPGRFTYPAPPDFTGSMVVRTALYEENGGYEDLLGPFDEDLYSGAALPLWDRLRALEPSLWRGGETYPTSGPDVAELYAGNEIDAYLSYGSGGVQQQIDDGLIRETTRTAVFDTGNIGNVNFLSIPFNSPDKAGAMVVANILQSPDAQYEKKVNPPFYPPAIDTTAAGEFTERFAAIEVPASELSDDVIADATVPELQAEWLTRIEEDWETQVLQQ